MRIVHLTASTFFGGPERQMLGLARHLPADCRTSFVSFPEGGRCQEFLKHVRWNGFDGQSLRRDTPNLPGAALELSNYLNRFDADVLLCHGYKANIVGRIAARQNGIPAIAVSRGWTGENRKVRLYEALDRLHLRYMDRIVCVSQGQARKVRRAGAPPGKIVVIPNAARLGAFEAPDPEAREELESLFDRNCERIVVGAGRLSTEKGVAVLIDAAKRVIESDSGARFVVFGEGAQRPMLERMIGEADLEGLFVLPGFRGDLDRLLPCADLFVLPSFTEGLPNVILEAGAASVPVVATAVGGTPEVVADGRTGFLIPPDDAEIMAEKIVELLADDTRRKQMGEAGRRLVAKHFTFEAQAAAYMQLFAQLKLGRTRLQTAA
jgi:glycosyltransferase involved in cell wall biosynthesis